MRIYCTYGENQGPKIRAYSPKRMLQQMIYLKNKYDFAVFQFRDPVFGLSRRWVLEFCEELSNSEYSFKWGIETRLDLLTTDLLDTMKEVGLVSINVGIETPNPEIAKGNKENCPPLLIRRILLTILRKLVLESIHFTF